MVYPDPNAIQSDKYTRKPLTIQAIEVTVENIEQLAKQFDGVITRDYRSDKEPRVSAELQSNGPEEMRKYRFAVVPGSLIITDDPEATNMRPTPYAIDKASFQALYDKKSETYIKL